MTEPNQGNYDRCATFYVWVVFYRQGEEEFNYLAGFTGRVKPKTD